jgi:hypothetical protein
MQANRSIPPLLALVLVAGCSASGGPASPTPPSPSPGTADFTIEVFPADEPSASRMAIPGSGYCFLVVVTDATGAAGGPVEISATATMATISKILPVELQPGVVGEVWVIADPATTEVMGSVTITGTRNGASQSVTRSLPVFPMAGERAADARPHFERWLAWLIAEHPELGITADTEWEPVFVSTLLVVSHYSYWSEDWELTISWHNMIPPHDWSEAFLRRRGEETAPSLAWRQDSVKGKTEPREVTPPDSVVR